jgi:uncharacterized protein (DUF885 family)
MKRYLAALCAAFVLAGCDNDGLSNPNVVEEVQGPSADEILAADLAGLTLDEFYEESWKALLYRSPETIVQLALTEIYPLEEAVLDNITDDYRRETYAMLQVALDALHSYDRPSLDLDAQLHYDFYEWYLQDRLESQQFMYHEFRTAFNFVGVQNGIETFMSEIQPLETAQDAKDYVERVENVSRKLDGLIEYLGLQGGAGIVEPRITIDWALYGIGQVADTAPAQTSFFLRLRENIPQIPELSTLQEARLLERTLNAVRFEILPAYQYLRTRLQDLREIAPTEIGVGQYPSGPEYYAYTLRHRTTTDLTPAEIHQLGLDHLARIHAEMRVLFDELGYPQDETLPELFARVAQDGGIIPAADVRTTYEGIIGAAEMMLDDAFDIFPSANVVVEEDQYGGYYIGPSFDGSRPGAFYASTRFDEPYYAMPSLTYHEAVPGHHTQIAIAMDIDTGPTFRRVVRFTAFVEGWALYAERLAFELGWYDNDIYGNLGRLQYEALRAARLVMDTGIHSLGWSFEQAVQFNIDNVGWSRSASESAVARYSVAPAQATAYMIGMLHILDARQRAQDALGASFDLREFHRVVLTSGGLPLALLDNVVDRYIQEASQP